MGINENLAILETGFEEYQIKLSKYILRFIFTSVYKNNFFTTLENNKFLFENGILDIINEIKYKNTKINILIDDEDIEINY